MSQTHDYDHRNRIAERASGIDLRFGPPFRAIPIILCVPVSLN